MPRQPKKQKVEMEGFSRKEHGLPPSWNNEETKDYVSAYLARYNFELVNPDDYTQWKCTSNIDVRCLKCRTTGSPRLNNLQRGQGISCFCSGKMRMTDPQYYDAMCNPEIYRLLGCYEAFHRETQRVEMPSREVFTEVVTKHSNAGILPGLKCLDCGITSDLTTIATLQQGGGIDCFCEGLSWEDPRYYQSICNAQLCAKLELFGAIHRSEKRVILPTEQEFISAVANTKKRCDVKIPKLKCADCKTTVDTTRLSCLRAGNGIPCFCSGQMPTTDPQYYRALRETWSRSRGDESHLYTWPTQDEFHSAVQAKGDCAKIKIECTRCETFAETKVGDLRANNGIACFCSNTMRVTDEQYYEVMCDPVRCNKLGWFQVFHKEDKPARLPTKEEFKFDVTGVQPPVFQKLYCENCGTYATNVPVSSLKRQRDSIACFCSGNMRMSDPQYYSALCNRDLCLRLGCFKAFHDEPCQVDTPSRQEFDEAIQLSHEMNDATRATLRICCRKCRAYTNMQISLLRANYGPACFCDGKLLSSDPEQFYEIMCDVERCRVLKRFLAFHDGTYGHIELPTKEDFLVAVASRNEKWEVRLEHLRCAVCKVVCSTTTLAALKQNRGIPCFCTGQLSLADPQYYQLMCDPERCRQLNVFPAFHRTVRRVLIPPVEQFREDVMQEGYDPRLRLQCADCHTISHTTRIGNLRAGHGISCKCTTSLMERWALEAFINKSDEFVVLGADQLEWAPVTVKYEGRSLRWDFVVKHIPTGKIGAGEIDGEHHFLDKCYYGKTIWQDNHTRDQLKLDSRVAGVTPPCTNGEPLSFVFRISYKCRTEEECKELVTRVATCCAQEEFICLPVDTPLYGSNGVPHFLGQPHV